MISGLVPLVFHGAFPVQIPLLPLWSFLQHFIGWIISLIFIEEVVHSSYPHSQVLRLDREPGCIPLACLGDHGDH